jgi:hypothetical protein
VQCPVELALWNRFQNVAYTSNGLE